MKSVLLINWLSLAICHQIPSRSQEQKCRDTVIKWGPCDETTLSLATAPVQCGHLDVPLDYTEKGSGETLTLDLIRVPATEGKRVLNGSIIFNWGGPGAEGLGAMARFAAQMLDVTGGYNDLISFNPRGTGKTIPFSCYETEAERALAASRAPEYYGDASSTSLSRVWAHSQIIASKCHAAMSSKSGSLVGSAFVVRDMMRIVDALNEDGMLRFWGLSYGSALGATAAAMFPDRVDKIILDGIQDPIEYYHSYDLEMLLKADEAASGFFSACIAAGPEACALAKHNSTASELENTVFKFLNALRTNPIPAGDYILDYSQMTTYFMGGLAWPETWPDVSRALHLALERDTEALAGLAGGIYQSGTAGDAYLGIRCGDKSARTDSFEEMREAFDKVAASSRWFGGGTAGIITACSQWKMQAKERYDGDFKVQTKGPVLILANTYDPTTPIDAAWKLEKLLGGSVVLEQNGFGHTSVAQRCNCTDEVVRRYLAQGTLPGKGTICSVDEDPFAA